ncbi:hypothetical protein MBEHAL_1202 [Halarchaeum acidiphilum MH1-52-1]|uniref:Uncharacterized protein n=1 Tax=Halarchaeum acidiphilum MH1-52-1 TaxID=1261545 RepID=U2YUL3_9EURY|nr:hypothetical protein MBEHAL_1202 [Halarchaeum acidiphilum MH1-52-1]
MRTHAPAFAGIDSDDVSKATAASTGKRKRALDTRTDRSIHRR